MASISRSGSSRRKPEVPGRIRLQLKGKSSKILESDDEVVSGGESSTENPEKDDRPPVDNIIPDDLPEGTIIVQPQAVEDAPVKKKKEASVRIDTSVLDNVSCTACGRQLNPYKSSALQKHPELKVVICKRCDKFLSSGEIAKDKDGTDEQCRWCGEGGRLVVCDECTSAFCRACVMRNFNRSEFTNINSQSNWKCYLCDRAPLQGLREKYRKIRDTLKALQGKNKAKASASAATPSTNGTGRSENSIGSKQQSSKSVPSASVAKSVSSSGNTATQKSENSKMSSLQGDILTLKDFTVNFDNVDLVMNKLSTATNTFREMLKALRSQFHSTSPCKPEDNPPLFKFSFSTTMDVREKKRRCAKALNMGLQTYVKSLISILSDSSDKQEAMKVMENLMAPVTDSSLSLAKDFPELSRQSTSKSSSADEHRKVISSSTKSTDNLSSTHKSVPKDIAKDLSCKSTVNAEDMVDKDKKQKSSESASSGSEPVDKSNGNSVTPLSDEKITAKKVGRTVNDDKSEARKNGREKLGKASDEVAQCSDGGEEEMQPEKTKSLHLSEPAVLSKKVGSKKNVERSVGENEETGKLAVEEGSLDENLAAKKDMLKEFEESDDNMETSDAIVETSELEVESSAANKIVGDENTDEKKNKKKTDKEKKPLVLKNTDSMSAKITKALASKSDTDSMSAKITKALASKSDTDSMSAKITKALASKSDPEKKARKSNETEDHDSDSDLLYLSDDDDVPSPKQTSSKKKVVESKESGLKLKISTKKEERVPEANKDKTEVNGKESVEDNVDEIDKEIDKLSKLPTVRKRKVKEVDESEETDKSEPAKKASRLSKPAAERVGGMPSTKRVGGRGGGKEDCVVTICVEPGPLPENRKPPTTETPLEAPDNRDPSRSP
ncbi:hypothetical protein Btru_071063 [Bulinus truncatus]|nr:hypothetical protein Btru_071063 [Bulinus truncatus]